MDNFLPITTIAILVAVVLLLVIILRKIPKPDASSSLSPRLDVIERAQERTERAVREEVAQTRDELWNYGTVFTMLSYFGEKRGHYLRGNSRI